MNTVDKIKENKIVAVIRNANLDNILPIVKALHKGGVNVVEITAETPKVCSLTERVVDEVGDQMEIGVGTVLDPETARAVLMAGAQFIVTPTLNPDTIKIGNRYGIPTISGALTPTEILTAYETGAEMVKVFPADLFGPNYIKNIHGPLPHIPIMVTGGIHLENFTSYLTQGCAAVGIGSSLVNVKELYTEADYNRLTEKASEFVSKMK